MDEQRSGRPSTSADLARDIDTAVQADRYVSIAQLEIRFNLSLFMKVSATGKFASGGFPVN
jgi:hypothetical protein